MAANALSGLPAVCGPVARARRFAPPPGEACRMLQNFPGGDAAHLSGLRVPGGLRSRSPGRRFAPPPGEACRMLQNFPGGDAAHLSGLRVPGGLRSRSPGRRFAPPPGGKRTGCCRIFPEAMLRICPGYASPAVCGPVARAGALRRPRGEACRMLQNFPGGDAAHLSGLRVPGGLRSRSPGRRFAPPPGETCRMLQNFPGGDAAHLSGLLFPGGKTHQPYAELICSLQ